MNTFVYFIHLIHATMPQCLFPQKSYKEVISDCTKAIALNNRYVKAMNRRAKACEQTGDLTQCLEGKALKVFLCSIVPVNTTGLIISTWYIYSSLVLGADIMHCYIHFY